MREFGGGIGKEEILLLDNIAKTFLEREQKQNTKQARNGM